MKVYLLKESFEYDGDVIVGIYSNKEHAEAELSRILLAIKNIPSRKSSVNQTREDHVKYYESRLSYLKKNKIAHISQSAELLIDEWDVIQ